MNIELSRRTDLAIKAMQVLTDTQDRMSGALLAEEIGTTTQFLPQVLAPLEEISLFELIESTEGAIESGSCVLRDGPCPGAEGCPVHTAWMSAREILVQRFKEMSLAQALTTEVGA